MKSKILLLITGMCIWMQIGCKHPECEKNGAGLARLSELESGPMSALDFCSLTSKERELHFGLDRNANTNNYVYTAAQVYAGEANLYANFKYFDGTLRDLDSSNQSLALNDLISLYNVLRYDSSVGYNPDSSYSALRMHFGLEGRRIILIYEPVVLKPIGTSKECNVIGTDKYFRADAADYLIPVSNMDFATLTNNLRSTTSNIRINHPNNPTVSNFINTSDSSGDIRSNIISFQQVVRMYCDNTGVESMPDRIRFTIVANQNETLTSNFRMHVVPNYNLGASSPIPGSYRSYAADYTQMCPTICNIVTVNIYD